jgi:prophage antirepressor-like protein
MSELIQIIDNSFNFNNETIRITGTFEDPWFVAKDVCSILGLENVTNTVKPLPEKWRGLKLLSTPSGNQNTNIINEAGLYRLIMRSNKKIAQKFQEWVCEEVLPSLRKKGEYKMKEEYLLKLEEQTKLLEEKDKELEHTKKQLDVTDYILKRTEVNLEKAKNYTETILRRKYQDYEKGDVIYAFKDNIYDKNSMIKIGKTKDIKSRETDYSVTNKSGNMMYIQYCLNSDLTEKVLHHILDKYRYIAKQEWFHNLPSDEFVIQTIKSVIYIMDSHMEDINTFIPDLYSKLDLEKTPTVPIEFLTENKTNEIVVEEKKEIEKPVFEEIKYDSNEILQEVSKHIINGRDTPLNFEKFISDYFEVGNNLFAPQSDVRDAYRIWSNCSTKEAKTGLAEYLKAKFRTGVEFINDERRNVYRGLQLKPLEYNPSSKMLEYEEFIIEKCKLDYTYRITFVEFFKYFVEWKQIKDPTFTLNTNYKTEIKTYLESIFMNGRVKSMSEEHKSGALFGVWGLGVFENNFGDKTTSLRMKRKVAEYNFDTKELVKVYDSLILASKETGITYSSLGYNIKFEKVVNNKLYKYYGN